MKLIPETSIPLRPITHDPETLAQKREASREEIMLMALRNALNAQQTTRQRTVVRKMIVDAYREIARDF